MRRIFYALILLGLLAWVGAAAEPALLPDHFGPWQAEGPSQMKVRRKDYTKAGGEVMPGTLREAGLRAGRRPQLQERRRTTKTVPSITFKDPSGAYEFYTEAIAPGMKSAGLGDESAFGPHNGAILIGNMVVRCRSFLESKARRAWRNC